jgi:uncharacterized membrane protein
MAVTERLDRAFRITVTIKAIDGALEIIGGLVLLVLSPSQINAIVHSLTQHELSEDPHDFFARHLLQSTSALSRSAATYAGVYLLIHGVAKLFVTIAVLRDHLWAYPAMIVLLGAFIVYQLYRIAIDPTIGLVLLTAFDALVVWLTWREYRSRRPPSP